MLRIVLPPVALAGLAAVDVSVGISVYVFVVVILVVNIDVAASPIAVTPVTTPCTPRSGA